MAHINTFVDLHPIHQDAIKQGLCKMCHLCEHGHFLSDEKVKEINIDRFSCGISVSDEPIRLCPEFDYSQKLVGIDHELEEFLCIGQN